MSDLSEQTSFDGSGPEPKGRDRQFFAVPVPKVVVALTGKAGVVAVRALRARLGAGTKRAGLAQWMEKSFTPDMTLLYGRGASTHQAIGPLAWTVRELAPVRSFLGATRHDGLGRWPLRG